MTLLAIDFQNLHQILRDLYQDMMPLCADMVGVAKGIAGLGAMFYVAYRVWQQLSRAEPIDVFPLLRPLVLGFAIMFFPTVVLGSINAIMSPVVKGAHGIMESQIENVAELEAERERLEYQARVREGKEWLMDDAAYDEKLSELGIRHVGKIVSMWWERTWYGIKMWWRQLVNDFFELMYNAAALSVDTIRTFFLVVLAILGPISFAISVWDGFQSSLTQWMTRYLTVYLWLPVADIFSAVLSKIKGLMLQADINALQDPNYLPDGSNGVYIIFLIIGIIGYFTVPTVANWIVQAGGMGSYGKNVNQAAVKTAAVAAGTTGAIAGNIMGKLKGKK